eukprot:544550-Hanusia_phi.AAC.1
MSQEECFAVKGRKEGCFAGCDRSRWRSCLTGRPMVPCYFIDVYGHGGDDGVGSDNDDDGGDGYGDGDGGGGDGGGDDDDDG